MESVGRPLLTICCIGANQMLESLLSNVVDAYFTKSITVKQVDTNNWGAIVFGPEYITCNKLQFKKTCLHKTAWSST